MAYRWDDAVGVDVLEGDATEALSAAIKSSMRARLVLCMGLFEWVVWRFDGLHDRAEPHQILEAGWCATVDPRYLAFFELPRQEWLGPVEGPLWCAATWLQQGLSQSHLYSKHVYDCVWLLTRLGAHVAPDAEVFQSWLSLTLERLVANFPEKPDDPFDDLFERDFQGRFGELIGRSALDPNEPIDLHRAGDFLADVLDHASQAHNPFLATPDVLADLGFAGVPYRLP
jgi:hypothetical protein